MEVLTNSTDRITAVFLERARCLSFYQGNNLGFRRADPVHPIRPGDQQGEKSQTGDGRNSQGFPSRWCGRDVTDPGKCEEPDHQPEDVDARALCGSSCAYVDHQSDQPKPAFHNQCGWYGCP